MNYYQWRETSVGVYGRNHVGISSEKYLYKIPIEFNFNKFKQGGLDDYEKAMYATLIGDLENVSIL